MSTLCALPTATRKTTGSILKQAVLELLVSQDGGIPFVSESWDGNTSDARIFQERTAALLSAFKTTPSPRYLIADAKLYCEDNAASLAKLGFITRIPATLKVVAQVINQALQWNTWQPGDPHTRYQPLALGYYGMVKRWLVVYSQAALERVAATLKKATQRENEAITKPTLSSPSPTLWHTPSRSGGPGGLGQVLEVSLRGVLSSDGTQTLRWQRPSHTAHAPRGQRVANPGSSAGG